MRIDSSYVGMESARSYTSVTQQTTSYFVAAGTLSKTDFRQDNKSMKDYVGAEASKEGEAQNSYKELSNRYRNVSASEKISSTEEKRSMESIRRQCVQHLIKWLYDTFATHRSKKDDSIGDSLSDQLTQTQNLILQPQATTFATLQANTWHYHKEEERTAFSTQGKVVTADGREINFQLGLTMSRSFEEYYQETAAITTVQMLDPLVINLDGNIAGLSDQKFEFDLDNDGVLDSISMLNKGSGYIALDKNDDGVINDGSELFGTKSGDGFKDLAAYDEDGNGWIDENDAIWKKLLIWTKDESGKDKLYHLADKGVGAICLQEAQTNFSLNSLKTNQTNGQIRQTGIFLYENGTVGTMQNIDVAS